MNMNMNTNPSSNSSPFYFCEPEFAELLWENGEVVTHDHTARPPSKFPHQFRHDVQLDHEATRHASTTITTATTATATATGVGNAYGYSIGKANIDILSADAHAGADDENTVPWMHYSHHDPLPPLSSPLPSDDFCSDFIEGFAGANPTSVGYGLPLPPAQPAAAPAQLSKGDTGVTNFSLFRDRLASGARASTSSKHTYAPPAQLKETPKTHDQSLLPPPVAPPSVCSVNDDGAQSTEPKQASKRKIREADDSSSNTSEDMDDESAGEKNIPTGRGSSAKKSRAAAVHNLSERRRRERINEKMKALQELIPNCSKADKASMLDDAIEYLKTLQLQVQMMSMGNGMYMPPPLMMPSMMPPLRAPHMAHYSSLGMGFYQMGMYPQLHPQHFMQGPPAMHGMIAPMPVNPQVPEATSVNTRPTTVVSSSEKAAIVAADTSVGSTYVRESTGAANPAKPDPKTEML